MEFVIVFPIIIFLFIAVFETGMILTRQVMLERALDSTVRLLRLELVNPPDEPDAFATAVRQNICANALVIPNCMDVLQLDLRAIGQTNYILPERNALCINRNDMVAPDENQVSEGRENDEALENLMLVRTCVVVDRILPISGFGLNLTRDDSGGLHMVSSTVYVNEPD
ncbi:pilus assembly protein [Fontisubflavum oceani]|uniref:TadE/TadG family type IV pilus assembly protein n=1 Tax=Fontisubflavum oceani TaxID=2978973 RepID=UPI0025B38723|nr:TadE family protein [Fontisubflavum oceani]WJY23108.1 pilus assembly protein [Fontisubflavum oceani]